MINITSFGNHGYQSDEADVVALNDDRQASLSKFRRLTSVDLTNSIDQHPTLMLARLKANIENENGAYVNEMVSPVDPDGVGITIDSQQPTTTDSPKRFKNAVEVRDVSFTYGYGINSLLTLKKINLTVPQGKIYALLGSSGCGKTTLLRCVLGRLKPQHGLIRVFNREPGSKFSPVPGCGVGYMPQELALFPDFTIKETLRYFGQLYKMSPKEIKSRTKFLITLLHLPEKSRLVANLSGGQQRRVSLAAALVHHPPLLILDEPTVGVDPVLRKAIWEHLDALCKEDGLTVVITTHYIEEARTAETVGLMRFGRMLVESNPDKLLEYHGLPTLEAVFLKLCQLDSGPESQRVNQLDTNANEKTEDKNNYTISIIDSEKKNIKNLEIIINDTDNGTVKPYIQIDDHDEIQNQTDKINDNKLKSGMTQDKPNALSVATIPTTFKDVSAMVTPKSMTPKSGSLSENSIEAVYATVKIPETRRKNFDWDRVHALFIKNIIRLMRNVPILLFYFFLPSIQIALFCICIGQDPKNIPIAIYNAEDPPGLSAEYLSFLDKNIVVQVPYDSLQDARQAVVDGKAWAAVHFESNYSYSLNQRRLLAGRADNDTIDSSNIKLYMDMSNQVIGFVLLRTFFKGFQAFAQDYLTLLGYNPATVTLPITVEETVYGEQNPSMTAFMAPGVILLIAYYATTALTALSLVLERKDGLLERSLTAGVTSIEFLTSHIMTQVIVLTIQEILMLITTFVLFSVKSEGPMIWVFALTFFQGVAGVMFGLFISSICADEVSAAMLGMGSFFPTIMLGGIFWPIQSMPDWMSAIAAFLPQTLPVEAMRFILSRGWDVFYYEVNIGFIATFGWIIVYLLAAVFIFKRYTT